MALVYGEYATGSGDAGSGARGRRSRPVGEPRLPPGSSTGARLTAKVDPTTLTPRRAIVGSNCLSFDTRPPLHALRYCDHTVRLDLPLL